MNVVEKISSIFLSFAVASLFLLAFSDTIFPFSRFQMFSAPMDNACSVLVLNENNQVIPLGTDIAIEEVQALVNDGYEAHICDTLRAQFSLSSEYFSVYEVCQTYDFKAKRISVASPNQRVNCTHPKYE